MARKASVAAYLSCPRIPAILMIASIILVVISGSHILAGTTIYRNWSVPDASHRSDEATACPPAKPNLILSALDSAHMLDTIFIFMQSLDVSLGKTMLLARQQNLCPPAEVEVKVMMPIDIVHEIPASFRAMMERYPYLEFIGGISDTNAPIVFRRFVGFAKYLPRIQSSYGKVLLSDVDVAFQRDPFSMPLRPGVELVLFREWRGWKIGQDQVHIDWFNGCSHTSNGAFITEEQILSYYPLDRIRAGSTYGTSRAISVYLSTMASQLELSNNECNDQALHIYLFYSGIFDTELMAAHIGRVEAVSDSEALIGTFGTTPMVRYNEWGEILNELDEVLVAIHQFKHHSRLTEILSRKYAWLSEVSGQPRPPMPKMEVHERWKAEHPEEQLPRYVLVGNNESSCAEPDKLCSCKGTNCQWPWWEGHWWELEN